MALSGSKRAAAPRSLLTSNERKTLQIPVLRCLHGSGRARNAQSAPGQTTDDLRPGVADWPMERADARPLLRSTVGLTGPRTDDTSASRGRKQGSAQRAPPHSLLVRSGSVPRRLSVLAFTRERNSGGCSSGSHFRERRSGSCAIVGSGQGVFADNLDGVVAQLAARFGISEITGSRAALGGRCF
jgi:hypothetical protein